ncbi:flagellar brake protein [Thioalkalivibrio sp. ALJ16]|uniref:flagellar brake protein n=1 Tax=Thioalkalivibrio sp. ALJ16 TaxID=1158762 RepID=UPI000374DCBB|nr:flagellar brake protein [Thioalkalivibrio sp. ALJ16]
MDETEYTVDNPDRIAGILKDLDHKLTLISVRLDEDGPLFGSALVRLDPTAREVFLDELTPPRAHGLVHTGSGLRVFAALRGVAVRFSTTVTRIEQEQQGALYVCPYPESLYYLQRRETFRVHIPMAQRPKVELNTKGWSEPVIGELTDLSVRGMCIELPTSTLDSLEIGTFLAFSNLLLPEVRERLSGDLRLANRRRSARDGYEYAGFEVAGSDQWLERQTNIALLHYQREARRRSME